MPTNAGTVLRNTPPTPSDRDAKGLSQGGVFFFFLLSSSYPAPPPAPTGPLGLVGIPPPGCQSPSVNKALIGCCPVGTGPPEKSNYWLRGFKEAQGRLMKGDKLGTVSRTPAGRPQQPPEPRCRGEPADQRNPERKGKRALSPGRPSPAAISDLGWGLGPLVGAPGLGSRLGRCGLQGSSREPGAGR